MMVVERRQQSLSTCKRTGLEVASAADCRKKEGMRREGEAEKGWVRLGNVWLDLWHSV